MITASARIARSQGSLVSKLATKEISISMKHGHHESRKCLSRAQFYLAISAYINISAFISSVEAKIPPDQEASSQVEGCLKAEANLSQAISLWRSFAPGLNSCTGELLTEEVCREDDASSSSIAVLCKLRKLDSTIDSLVCAPCRCLRVKLGAAGVAYTEGLPRGAV